MARKPRRPEDGGPAPGDVGGPNRYPGKLTRQLRIRGSGSQGRLDLWGGAWQVGSGSKRWAAAALGLPKEADVTLLRRLSRQTRRTLFPPAQRPLRSCVHSCLHSCLHS